MRRSLVRVVWALRTPGPVASFGMAPKVIRRLRVQERRAPVEKYAYEGRASAAMIRSATTVRSAPLMSG